MLRSNGFKDLLKGTKKLRRRSDTMRPSPELTEAQRALDLAIQWFQEALAKERIG